MNGLHTPSSSSALSLESLNLHDSATSRLQKAHYSPPWSDTSIIGIAGSSGSGKTSLAYAIIKELSLPWVVILSMDSFYKPLTPEQSAAAFRNEYDFDAPEAIDFDVLVDRLSDIKLGKKAEIPVYSFEKHARLKKTTTIYSPHVLILEGIFALHDQRVLDMLDMKIFAEADADLCLSRRLLRDVRERGRDIEGCIKQWFAYVKPNFHKFVEPQRNVADIIVPRGIENTVAIGMVSDRVHKTLDEKSAVHQAELRRLGQASEDAPLSDHVIMLEHNNQIRGINTKLIESTTDREDFVFYFDRLAVLLVEKATDCFRFQPITVQTPVPNESYNGLVAEGIVSAVVILRGGSILETGLKRVIPDCRTGRMLIQTNFRTGEPELHYYSLSPDIAQHTGVMLLDPQMSSGGAALMAVKVLLDHGVHEDRIVFVTCTAGNQGLRRLMSVFPEIKVIVSRMVDDLETRLLRRLTSTADALLDLSNATHRNAPPAPSHWTDHMHRRALLETWDRVHEAAGSSGSKYPKSLVGQLVSVEKEMLVEFPELVEGERGLGKEWMEYVLGAGLRFPWCITEKMGKWEVVASVGKLGARGWGPW
ncbi:hypothetical protein B0A48_05010 [Cryoendolithus antarcticus]|uniref:Uridine kinase n=1 Tax=Cryoendolithus antarcticus TaxID=1507870 RepID=A0A1V8TEE1_9PEZI|nr:hypothetical protein B0A48_05010 [Cryoendolithus antarcticus]